MHRTRFLNTFVSMRQVIITFGLLILCTLVLFQVGKFAYFRYNLSIELLIGIFAGIFLIVGLLIANKHNPAPAHEPQDKSADPAPGVNRDKIDELGISKREYEVLCEVALGLSNLEIAAKLFVSESTVKTHISSLLVKLNARRRTEAVKNAKELNIID